MEECRYDAAETFLFYNQTLDGTTFLGVDRVRESKEAHTRNNARPHFICLLQLSFLIETLEVTATHVPQEARTLLSSS